MRKRGLCCRPVSVCPHVTLATYTGGRIILVFDPSADTQSQCELLQQGRKTGVGKCCDFRLKSPSVSETVQDGRYGTLMESHALYRMVTFSMTLTNP